MTDLHLFGGLAVDRQGRAPAATVRHRHPLALLAAIAAAAPRPVARDKLMAHLWPESDAVRASNSLRQTLFRIRRSLGDDVFLPESAAGLQLNPGRLSVDVWAFREALERGALEAAVEVYEGPFLDGFAIPGAAEFALWVEGERDRLSRQHLGALEALAGRAAGKGRLEEAANWRRRLAAADPFSSRVALGLLKALVAAGDVPGALEFARTYENLVRLHLEAEPDPAVMEFVASLGGVRPAAGAARTLEADRPPHAPTEPPSTGAGESGSAGPSPEPEEPRARSVRGRGRWPAAAAIVVLALGLGRALVVAVRADASGRDGVAAPAYEAPPWGTSECARNVAEADRYTLVYALPIPEDANYQDGLPPYSVDRSGSIGPFDRVAYCLQLDEKWVWASMDAFTDVPAQLGVPVSATGATFQRTVSALNVYSGVPGVVTGTGITTGSIEFWHQCYDEPASLGFAGASSALSDFDDVYPHPHYDTDSCYGSMQVHDFGSRRTVFAYNQWDRDPPYNSGPDDLGIGTAPPPGQPDWTFAANADQYRERALYILARVTATGPRR